MAAQSPTDSAVAGFEPLKNRFGADVPRRIAAMISGVHPTFPSQAFVREALRGYEELELTPRGRQIAHALRRHLPDDYPAAVQILVASLGERIAGDALEGMSSFLYMPHAFFVAEYGLGHLKLSLDAQYEITQRFTAEFSIRPYLVHHRDATLARLREWAGDPNVHVRRLVSEGTRPRLPWAPVLREFVANPSPVLELLELLKDDPELYVRRSVANNLNDIAKDHPDLVVEVSRQWWADAGDDRRWLIRRALRTLVKRGHPGALDVLGFGLTTDVRVDNVAIAPPRPRIGDRVRIEATLTNIDTAPAQVLVDLRVGFVKAKGTSSPKVFKLTTAEIEPGGTLRLSKSIALNQQTTRTHYPGRHELELLVNGVAHAIGHFDLAEP